MPFHPETNEHSYRTASLAEQVQNQHPFQLRQAPVGQFLRRPQDELSALPTPEEAAWTEYLQDAHCWQPGDPFSNLAQRRGATIRPLALPIRTSRQAWRSELYTPQQIESDADNRVRTAPLRSPRRLTGIAKQVLLEIITRLNARGTRIDKDTLTTEAAERIIAAYATSAEQAAILEDQQAYSQAPIRKDFYQPAQTVEIDLEDKPDQEDTPTYEYLWMADYRGQLSPTRLANGGSSQFHNKHNRRHLRTKCFPCYAAKRKCDLDKQPSGICSQCAHQAELFPNLYDPDRICVIDETQEYKDFKDNRATVHSKAKALGDDDWLAKRQVRQERKAKEKQEARS